MFQRSNNRIELKDNRRLCWYACLFDQKTIITEPDQTGKIITYPEVIRAGAFAKSLESGSEVVANINHSNDSIFARISDNTLLLQEDPKGLYCSCWIREDAIGDEIINQVQQGKLNGSSFRFTDVESIITADLTERLVLNLWDVCLTDIPAYPQTKGEVHLRTKRDYISSRIRIIKIKQKRINSL